MFPFKSQLDSTVFMNLSSFGHLLFILIERTNTAVNHMRFFYDGIAEDGQDIG